MYRKKNYIQPIHFQFIPKGNFIMNDHYNGKSITCKQLFPQKDLMYLFRFAPVRNVALNKTTLKSLVNSILEIQFCNPSKFLKGSVEVWPLFAFMKSPILKFLTKKRGGTCWEKKMFVSVNLCVDNNSIKSMS